MTALSEWLDDVVPLLDPAELPRVLTRADAQRRGYSDAMIQHRVISGRWRRMVAGIYLTVSDACAADFRQVAVQHGGPSCVLTSKAALAAYGLPVGPVRQETILVPPYVRVRNAERIRVRQTKRMPPRRWVSGVPVASVARAVADHVRTLNDLDDVRAVVASAVHRARASPDDLAAELEAGQRSGSRLFRQALAEVCLGARSAPEARAAAALRRAGIAGFEQNVEIIAGGRRYLADFLWRDLMAILEIDSRAHHYEAENWRTTMRRHTDLETAGYSAIHVSPSELTDEADFVARIRLWLASRRGASSVAGVVPGPREDDR